MSAGLMCLTCRRYIRGPAQWVNERDRCVCPQPVPSLDGVNVWYRPEPPRLRRKRWM